jgi:hypothetical protein
LKDAIALCPALAANPTGTYAAECANFDQLGIRVPPHCRLAILKAPLRLSHRRRYTSLLAFIEKRFLSTEVNDADFDRDGQEAEAGSHQHLTKSDQFANPLEDMFDFDDAPSRGIVLTQAAPQVVDCTPK